MSKNKKAKKEKKLASELFIAVNGSGEENAPTAQPAPGSAVCQRLSLEELYERVTAKRQFAVIDGQLHLFDKEQSIYEPVDEGLMLEIVRASLSPAELYGLKMSDYTAIHRFLRMQRSLVKTITEDPAIVVFRNGIYNILTGERLKPSPEIVRTSFVDANFLSDRFSEDDLGSAPVFCAFMDDVCGGKKSIYKLIVAFLGYCLLTGNPAKNFFVLGTAPDSGKSVIGRFLERLVGSDGFSNVALDEMGERFSLACLRGKSLNLSMDLGSHALSHKAVSRLKRLTGGDNLQVEAKFENGRTFKNRAKLVFATNHPISIKDEDPAFWERLVVIPFLHSMPKSQQDPCLLDDLWLERDEIVAILMAAARELIRDDFRFPRCKASEKMKAAWMASAKSSVEQFVNECCSLSNPEVRTHSCDLYQAFCDYCDGVGANKISANAFSREIKNRYNLESKRWMGKKGLLWGFCGITLL